VTPKAVIIKLTLAHILTNCTL